MLNYPKFILSLIFTILSISVVTMAQGNISVCTAILKQAMSQLAENCIDSSSNQVCYGSGTIEYDAIDSGVLSSNQQVDLVTIKSIATSSIDLNLSEIGTGVIHLMSDSDEDSIYLLLIGNTVIKNWATGDVLPFHDLSFATTSSDSCDNIHAGMAIYTPEETSFVIRINQTVFRIQGLVTLQTVNANSLLVTVHSGELEIVGRSTVTSGQTISAITNAGEILTWSAPRTINDAEQQFGLMINNTLQTMLGISLNIETPSVETTIAPQPSETCEDSPVHTVLAGENLYLIAQRYGVTIDSIVIANQLADSGQIYPAQQLVIPCGQDSSDPESLSITIPSGTCGNNVVHTVEVGQTIYLIAQGYGTTVDAITTANDIANPSLIHVGDQLIIPCSADQPVAPTVNETTPNETMPIQPELTGGDFCSTFFEFAPPGGYPQPMIDLYNQNCT